MCVALAVACDGGRFDLGDDDPPPVERPTDLAACPDSVEDFQPFENGDTMKQALEGRWYRCRGFAEGLLSFEAIEFAKNDVWYALEDDGTGHLVRSTDPSRYGVYAVSSPVFMTIYFSSGEDQSLTVLFDKDRRAMVAVRSTTIPTNTAYVHE